MSNSCGVQAAWQEYRDQIGREVKGEVTAPSAAWVEGTPDFFHKYACIFLEQIILHIGDPDLLTDDVLDAFEGLDHPMVILSLRANT